MLGLDTPAYPKGTCEVSPVKEHRMGTDRTAGGFTVDAQAAEDRTARMNPPGTQAMPRLSNSPYFKGSSAKQHYYPPLQ